MIIQEQIDKLIDNDQLDQAEEICRQALKKDNENPELMLLLARVLINKRHKGLLK